MVLSILGNTYLNKRDRGGGGEGGGVGNNKILQSFIHVQTCFTFCLNDVFENIYKPRHVIDTSWSGHGLWKN